MLCPIVASDRPVVVHVVAGSPRSAAPVIVSVTALGSDTGDAAGAAADVVNYLEGRCRDRGGRDPGHRRAGLDRDGPRRPHVSPLVAVWLDGAIHFSTGAEEQKAVNLRSNPHVILTTGCNQWNLGLDVVVEGDAVQVTDDETLQRLAEAWRTKWDGRWQFEVRGGRFHHDVGTALVFAVPPTKVLAFGKGTFTHTRHRF